jgi:EamA-like transporter family
LGFTTWAYALARTTSGRMGATIYAVPTLVIIMSWLILGQVPRWLAAAGGALCLAGVAVSRSRSRVDQKASAQPAEATPNLGADGAIDTLERNLQADLAARRANP